MISFLNPIFLAFGVAVLVPLALHMIQSSRTVRLPFSTIRFLKLAQQRSSRRIKMENFLLWLLRTLLMALLVLAFAMPMLRTKEFGSLLGRAARDVAIVVDASYSMDYRTGGPTLWAQATDLAASVIEGLSEKDRFCVFLAGEQVIPVCEQLTDKRQEMAARIRSLPPPKGSSQLCPATLAALASLDQESRRCERELHLISDTQLLPWTRFRRADPATVSTNTGAGSAGVGESLWDPARITENTTCFVTLLGATVPENVAPVAVEVAPRLVTADTPCQFTLRFLRSGPPVDTAVTLFVDGKETARRPISLLPGSSGETRVMTPPLGPGVHAVRVETPDDSLAVDNTFHLLVRAKEKLPALCVGSRENTVFLRTALGTAPGGVSPIEMKVVAADSLASETLSRYACIFLCNALPLAGQEIKRLERYVAAGGLLVVFPGDGCAIPDYRAWSCLPAVPVEVMDVPVAERKRLLNWDKPLHPVIQALKEGGLTPSIVVKRQLKCEPPKEKAETLVSTGAGYPFLLFGPAGRGAVLLFTVSADRLWSDFPLSPFYLPMTHQLIHYAAGIGVGAPYVWATESLPLDDFLPEPTRETVLTSPDGQPVPVRSAIVDGETVLYAENLTVPGVYTSGKPGGGSEVPVLAVDLPRGESDLSPVKREDIPSVLGVKSVHLATGRDELLRMIEELRVGKTLGELLLWLALVVALLESCYANVLMRRGSKLTDSLVVEASGKVKDKAS